MCKNLAELLQAEQPLFSIMLEQLERVSGRPSVDVRLLSEIIGKVHLKTKALGLDPHDTTSRELYHALQHLTAKHDVFMATRMGVKDPTDVVAVLRNAKAFVDGLAISKSTWALKHSVAKRLLKQNPPRQVMKQLHYRSIDSMLKREPISELFGSIRFLESKSWQRNFVKKYVALTPMDFEIRNIEIATYDSEKWQSAAEAFVRQSRNNITYAKELGMVMILPLPVKHMPGIALTTLVNILHAINEIKLYSTYFKLHQTSNTFGVFLREVIQDDVSHLSVLGHKMHWRAVYGHISKVANLRQLDMFDPYLQLEDLEWRKVEETLYKIEPALHFWHDMDFVAAYRGGEVVSFSIIDNAINYANKLPYERRTITAFRRFLQNEIMLRYAGQPHIESLVVEQLALRTIQNTAEFSSRSTHLIC